MTVSEKLRLLAEFAETGEEFEILGEIYKFTNGELGFYDFGEFTRSRLDITKLECTDITRLPFKPKLKELYFFIDFTRPCGYMYYTYRNDGLDNLILSRKTVYRTEDEAIAEVERRGWKV